VGDIYTRKEREDMLKKSIKPVLVTDLFPEMREELLQVLSGLSDEEWSLPTICDGWSVKDVAIHILADDIGYLSRHRDNDGIDFSTDSWEELLRAINQQNDIWVRALRRASRRMLISLLEFTGAQFNDFMLSKSDDQGEISVAWAGNQAAPPWLEVAREYTEHWLHHQHICEAVDIESLKSRKYLHPVLAAFMHALPRTYESVHAPENTAIEIRVTGEAEDTWYLIREASAWGLYADTDISPEVVLEIPDDIAWRLFTKGISAEEAREHMMIEGDELLGSFLLQTVSIIA
jgi:uncharacterized protein (TIGR03083 family)